MTAAEVYAHIGQCIREIIPNTLWAKALLRIERTEGAQGYNGVWMTEEGMFVGLAANSLTEKSIFTPIEELYQVTTQGGNNEWNLLYFTLMPGGAFEVDFVLDEDAVTAREYISRTEQMPDAQRREGYRALQRQLSQARSLQLHISISRRLPALAAVMQPNWQQLTLHIEQWGGGFFRFKGVTQADELEEADEFNVTQDWALVKEFYQLCRMPYISSWNLATWSVKPDGTYSIVFDWNPAHGFNTPRGVAFPYTHEGRWQEPI